MIREKTRNSGPSRAVKSQEKGGQPKVKSSRTREEGAGRGQLPSPAVQNTGGPKTRGEPRNQSPWPGVQNLKVGKERPGDQSPETEETSQDQDHPTIGETRPPHAEAGTAPHQAQRHLPRRKELPNRNINLTCKLQGLFSVKTASAHISMSPSITRYN